jgi:hypothetical protein
MHTGHVAYNLRIFFPIQNTWPVCPIIAELKSQGKIDMYTRSVWVSLPLLPVYHVDWPTRNACERESFRSLHPESDVCALLLSYAKNHTKTRGMEGIWGGRPVICQLLPLQLRDSVCKLVASCIRFEFWRTQCELLPVGVRHDGRLKATGKKRRKRGASCERWWWTGCMSSVLLPLSSVASILLRTAGLNGGRGGPSRPLRLWGAVSPSRPCFSLSLFHFPLHYCSVATSGSAGVVSESGKKKPKEKMESTSLHTAERLFGCLLLLFHYFY